MKFEEYQKMDIFREIQEEVKKHPGLLNVEIKREKKKPRKKSKSEYYGCQYRLDAEQNNNICPHESCPYADYFEEIGGFQNLCFGKRAAELDKLWRKVLKYFADEKLI